MGEYDEALHSSHRRQASAAVRRAFAEKVGSVFFRIVALLALSPATGPMIEGELRAQLLPESQPVRIQTSAHAEVYLDGKLLGHADNSGTFRINLTPGLHKIRIEMHGKKQFEQTIVVVTGKKEVGIQAALADVTGTLEVLTVPGAEISVDEKPAGKADAEGRFSTDLAAGEVHRIRASREGRAPAFANASVSENAVSTVRLMLGEVVKIPVGPTSELGQLVFRRAFANPKPGGLKGVAFSPDSARVGAADGSGWVTWDVRSGRQVSISPVEPDAGDIAGISRDWDYLFLGLTFHGEGGVCERYGAAEPVHRQHPEIPLCRHEAKVRSLSSPTVLAGFARTPDISRDRDYFDFGPDSRRLLLATLNNCVSVYELPSGKRLWTTQEDGYLRQVLYSPRGDMVAAVFEGKRDGSVVLRDAATGKLWKAVTKPEWEKLQLALFRPDGEWFVVYQSADYNAQKPGQIRLFETKTLQEAAPLVLRPAEMLEGPSVGLANVFTFHPSGRYVAGAVHYTPDLSQWGGVWVKMSEKQAIRIWDLAQSREVWSEAMDDVNSVAFSPDGRWFAAAGKSLRLWEIIP